MIRRAKEEDASRVAEILVFVKRMKFRPIFQDDGYSFGELQVLPVAKKYLECGKTYLWLYWYTVLESGKNAGDQGESSASVESQLYL